MINYNATNNTIQSQFFSLLTPKKKRLKFSFCFANHFFKTH